MGEKLMKKLSYTCKGILQTILIEGNECSLEKIVDRLKVSSESIRVMIHTLINEGYIEKIFSENEKRYKVIKEFPVINLPSPDLLKYIDNIEEILKERIGITDEQLDLLKKQIGIK